MEHAITANQSEGRANVLRQKEGQFSWYKFRKWNITKVCHLEKVGMPLEVIWESLGQAPVIIYLRLFHFLI